MKLVKEEVGLSWCKICSRLEGGCTPLVIFSVRLIVQEMLMVVNRC